jgi:CHAT domain-containing protein
MSRFRYLLLVIITVTINFSFSQNTNQNNLKILDSLIANKEYQNAKQFSRKQFDSLIADKAFYLATDYIYYLGTIDLNLNGEKKAVQYILELERHFKELTDSPKALRQLSLEIGSFFEAIGQLNSAIDYNLKALEYTKNMPNALSKDFALIQSNLGVFYSLLGNIERATQYHQTALKSLQRDPNSSEESYYITYNSLGGMMWYASKFDSALFYYKSADKMLKTLEPNPLNIYYRPATLYNNMAGIYSIQGSLSEALQAMQITVEKLSSYLKEDISAVKRENATKFLFQAIDNYAGIYKDFGDFNKAKQLLNYALQLKINYFESSNPEIAKGKVLLGQINLALKNYDEAKSYLDEGIAGLESSPDTYYQWLADAYYYKAVLCLETHDIKSAQTYFELSENFFKKSLGDYYDEIYLNFIVNASAFYAKYGNKTKAVNMANNALDYIKKNQGNSTLLEYYQILNLAEIHFMLNDFNNASILCEKALNLIESEDFTKSNKTIKSEINRYKVGAILLQSKIDQKLNPIRDEPFLKSQLNNLTEAIRLLNQQKSYLAEDESTSILIQDNIDVFNYAKKICLDLYQITHNEQYLIDLLGFHESITYHKIRKRLQSKITSLTANLPAEILAEEKKLKLQLSQFSYSDNNFDQYVNHEKEWQAYLNKLKNNYPEYYKLMYATIHQPLDHIQSKIESSSTVIRYLFIDNRLYALLINNKQLDFFQLNSEDLVKQIENLNSKIETIDETFTLQYELYRKLWAPFKDKINTKSVIVIPDKELFNLSFELLTPRLINGYEEIKEHSLLAAFNISYNYSLFLIDKNKKPIYYSSNIVAFAPEFNDTMKDSYKISINDSVKIDHTYLQLLPQPFAKDLAIKYSKLFDGDSFINENASKQIFTQKAKEHKIIHIGTHAESDNISPEFSRLIFAKKETNDNNSLYTFEIYNQNLSSNLAILTACETGKPTYQPGEGMISLAHAFNYAGSESILTSLWNIDEQSSAKIISYFYNYLEKGLEKDLALKKAKLKYLNSTNGRTLNPQYWAGLVLIGNAESINLNTSNNLLFFIASLIVIFLILLLFRKKLTGFKVFNNK